MNERDSQYLAQYEHRLAEDLLRQMSDEGILEGQLLSAEELDEAWRRSAPEYMAAAVPQIASYPLVAIAWAAYVGIGAAVLWDVDWESYQEEDIYLLLAKSRGFDLLDEYVLEGLLGYKLDSKEAERVENLLRSAARYAQNMIQKEGVEAQSVIAFHIFARTTKVMYKMGVAIGLKITWIPLREAIELKFHPPINALVGIDDGLGVRPLILALRELIEHALYKALFGAYKEVHLHGRVVDLEHRLCGKRLSYRSLTRSLSVVIITALGCWARRLTNLSVVS